MPHSRRDFFKKAGLGGLIIPAIPFPGIVSENLNPEATTINGLTFLFQGDSITDGNRGRNNDPNHIMGHGYAFSIASRLGADFPGKHLKFINKGISGNKVTDLAKRWQSDALDLKPDVLSILIGVNDTASVVKKREDAVNTELFEETYKTLLEQSREKSPGILFVLGEPFILPVGTSNNWEQWEGDLVKRRTIVKQLAEKYEGVYVKYQDIFNGAVKRAAPEYWIWDGIHPTVAGHELMAREWIKQVSNKLHFLKKYRY